MLASFMTEPHHTNYQPNAFNNNKIHSRHEVIHRIEKIREFERLQLPFLKSVVDFDIVIEIGYAEERGQV